MAKHRMRSRSVGAVTVVVVAGAAAAAAYAGTRGHDTSTASTPTGGTGSPTPLASSPPVHAPSATPTQPASPPPTVAPPTTRPAPVAPHAPASVGNAVYTVRGGDTLWSITGQQLRAKGSEAAIANTWMRVWTANMGVIGSNPNVIRPGEVLRIPVLT